MIFYMHYHIDVITHDMAFVPPIGGTDWTIECKLSKQPEQQGWREPSIVLHSAKWDHRPPTVLPSFSLKTLTVTAHIQKCVTFR